MNLQNSFVSIFSNGCVGLKSMSEDLNNHGLKAVVNLSYLKTALAK